MRVFAIIARRRWAACAVRRGAVGRRGRAAPRGGAAARPGGANRLSSPAGAT